MKKQIKHLLLALGIVAISTNVSAKEISKNEIPENSYVIGNHVFTENTILTTRHIMLASKTIEGNSLNDMIIYYKAPGGTWMEGLSGEELNVPDKFDIYYEDTQIYTLNKPDLKYEVIGNVSGKYELTLEMDKENTGLIAGMEVYYAPIDSDKLSVIYDGTATAQGNKSGKEIYTYRVEKTKDELYGNYKVRTYNYVSDEKVYSDFSNTITYKKLEKPALKLVNTKKDNDDLIGTLKVENYSADEYTKFTIYEYLNYESFSKDNANFVYTIDKTKNQIDVNVVAGGKNYYKVKVERYYTGDFYYSNGEGYEYSELSDPISIDNINVEDPELTSEYVTSEINGNVLYNYYDLAITNKAVSNGYWELFEVSEYNSENQYTKVSSVPFGKTYRLKLSVENSKYAARICQEAYEKNCSDYSNIIEFTEDSIKEDTLSAIDLDIAYPQSDYYKDGIYTFSYEIKNHDEIPSYYAWTLYEVNGNDKTKISTSKMYEPIQFSIEAGKSKNLAIGICFAQKTDDLCDDIYAEIKNVDTISFLDTIPELNKVTGFKLDTVNGIYEFKLNLNNLEEYELFSKYENQRYLVQGWIIYEKLSDGSINEVQDVKMTEKEISVQIPTNEEKTYIARVYIEDTQGNKYYSDYSEELTIDTANI